MTTSAPLRNRLVDALAGVVFTGALLAVLVVLFPGPRFQPPLSTDAYPYVGDGWTAITVDTDGSPVAWELCAPIRWAYDPTGGPEGGLVMVAEAFRRMGALAGLEFVYAGEHRMEPTLDGPRFDDSGTPLPVRVSWRGSDHELLEERYVGLAWSGLHRAGDDAPLHIVTGTIVLNSDYLDETPLTFDQRTDFGVVTMHEIGHVLGLGHSGETTGLMSQGFHDDSPVIDDHDLRGIAALYPGCPQR